MEDAVMATLTSFRRKSKPLEEGKAQPTTRRTSSSIVRVRGEGEEEEGGRLRTASAAHARREPYERSAVLQSVGAC